MRHPFFIPSLCVLAVMIASMSMLGRTVVGVPLPATTQVKCIVANGGVAMHCYDASLASCWAPGEPIWSVDFEARPGIDWKCALPAYARVGDFSGGAAVRAFSLPFVTPVLLGLIGLALWKRRRRCRVRTGFVVEARRSQLVL